MAEVYKAVRGKSMASFIAHRRDVRKALKDAADEMAGVAKGLLAAHRHDGHARIERASGDLDQYVVLSDERGLKAAMSIEYGRRDNPETGEGGMAGLFILHRATHAPRR